MDLPDDDRATSMTTDEIVELVGAGRFPDDQYRGVADVDLSMARVLLARVAREVTREGEDDWSGFFAASMMNDAAGLLASLRVVVAALIRAADKDGGGQPRNREVLLAALAGIAREGAELNGLVQGLDAFNG